VAREKVVGFAKRLQSGIEAGRVLFRAGDSSKRLRNLVQGVL